MRRDWKKLKIGLENPYKIIGNPHLKSRRVLWVRVNTKAPFFLSDILLGCTSGAGPKEFPILSNLWGMRPNSHKTNVPEGDSGRRNEFSLEGNSFAFFLECTYRQLFNWAQKTSEFWRVWCSCRMFLPKIPHPDLKRKEKVDTQSLWSCLGWLWLASVVFWCFGCYHSGMCKTWRYQCMSPRLKGSLHFWLFCLFLSEFCSGSIVRISTLPRNLLWFWVPFFSF